jgi:hypothetical protein
VRLKEDPLWALSLYPDAVGSTRRRTDRQPPPSRRTRSGQPRRPVVGRGRRSAAYAAANRLNRLGTLTYRGEGCHDPMRLRDDLAGFFRELRAGLDTGRFPYVWVPQWHPGGHGLHAHFAVGRFIQRQLIERSWGNGFVHIKLLDGLPVGSGTLGEARLAARYLARYVGRDVEDERRLAGLHRYEVAQGFQPAKIACYGTTAEDVIERASGYMGSAPEQVWLSSSVEGWHGPPACWAQWN